MRRQQKREALQQELVEIKEALEDWRRHRRGRDPIPSELWSKAVELAGRHGVGAVAASLRLDHAKLKSKLAKKAASLPVPAQRGASAVQTTFVELFSTPSLAGAPTQRSGPVVRFRSPRGLEAQLDWGDSDVSGLAQILKELL